MSDNTAVGLRWMDGGSSKLPAAALCPDRESEQGALDHTRDTRLSASQSTQPSMSVATTWQSVQFDTTNSPSSRKRSRDYVSNEQVHKRAWVDSGKYIPMDAYGLDESDVDTVRIMITIKTAIKKTGIHSIQPLLRF
jgi:hypothetical protein